VDVVVDGDGDDRQPLLSPRNVAIAGILEGPSEVLDLCSPAWRGSVPLTKRIVPLPARRCVLAILRR